MCSGKDTSCWFDGDGCFCKFKGESCVSASKSHALCPVKRSRATVCRIDKDDNDAKIHLQCLLAATEQHCDVMSCPKLDNADHPTSTMPPY